MLMHQQFFYKEAGDFSVGEYLPFDQYVAAMKRMVRYANDIILVDTNGNFLLPQRKTNKSAAGPWFFGGQVPAFKTLADSLILTMQREAGLTINIDRFVHLAQTRVWFNGQEGFSHDSLSDVFFIKISDEEIKSIRLDTSEYEDLPLQTYTLKNLQELKEGVTKKVLIDMWNLFQQTTIDLH